MRQSVAWRGYRLDWPKVLGIAWALTWEHRGRNLALDLPTCFYCLRLNFGNFSKSHFYRLLQNCSRQFYSFLQILDRISWPKHCTTCRNRWSVSRFHFFSLLTWFLLFRARFCQNQPRSHFFQFFCLSQLWVTGSHVREKIQGWKSGASKRATGPCYAANGSSRSHLDPAIDMDKVIWKNWSK